MKDSGIFRIVEKTSKNDTKSKISKGKRGEIIAAKYLSDLSYDILEVNYTAIDSEIDIIAKEDRTASGVCAPPCGLYLNDVYY